MGKTWTPSWVPQAHTEAEKEHKAALVRALASDLSTSKVNYAATLESIVIHASALLADETTRTGRGLKRENRK